jgi:hypothetical protein
LIEKSHHSSSRGQNTGNVKSLTPRGINSLILPSPKDMKFQISIIILVPVCIALLHTQRWTLGSSTKLKQQRKIIEFIYCSAGFLSEFMQKYFST